MVVVLFVGIELRLAVALGLADHVRSEFQVRRRHADLREVELVGAVEPPLVRELVRFHDAPLHRGDGDDVAIERGLAQSDHRDVARFPEPVGLIHVDVGRDAPGRHWRVFGEILGTEEALLLSGHDGEKDRAPGRPRESGKGARDRQDRSHAGGVVDRAVVDVVGAGLRARLDPEMVVMRGVDDRLLRKLRVAAGDHADDVARFLARDRVREGERHLHAERHRPEGAHFRRRAELVEVLAAQRRDRFREFLGRPHLDPDARRALVRQLEVLARPGSLHDLPAVSGRVRRVDEDRADGALLRRHHVLVVPPAVPEARLACEDARIVLRVVVHHEEDLAREIRVLVVVPLVLGRHDAVADEDDLRVLDFRLQLLDSREGDEVGARLPLRLAALRAEDGRPGEGRLDADQRHLLNPAAAGGTRLDVHGLHLRLDIRLSQAVAARCGAPPLEEIGGEEADVGANPLWRDRARGRLLFRCYEGTLFPRAPDRGRGDR